MYKKFLQRYDINLALIKARLVKNGNTTVMDRKFTLSDFSSTDLAIDAIKNHVEITHADNLYHQVLDMRNSDPF